MHNYFFFYCTLHVGHGGASLQGIVLGVLLPACRNKKAKEQELTELFPLQHHHHRRSALSAHQQLTGEIIADKWLLSDDFRESTSGKSHICTKALRRNANGNTEGDPVIIKISPNTENSKLRQHW